MGTALEVFNEVKAQIAGLSEGYASLVTNGPEDKQALKEVKEARLVHRNIRLEIGRIHKEGKAKVLREGQAWDRAKRELIALVEPQEERLLLEEGKVKDELARREEIEAAKGRLALAERLDRLNAIGADLNQDVVAAMDPDQFEAYFNGEQIKADERKEQADLEAREAAAKAKVEADRVAAEQEQNRKDREELAALRAEQEKRQAVIDAENERILKEQAAKRAEQQAIEDAQRKEKQRLEDLAAEAERKRLDDEANAAREKAAKEAKKSEEAATLVARHVRDGEAIERLLEMMIEEGLGVISADHLGRLYIHLSDGKDAFGGEK